jgi:hypothetical protein
MTGGGLVKTVNYWSQGEGNPYRNQPYMNDPHQIAMIARESNMHKMGTLISRYAVLVADAGLIRVRMPCNAFGKLSVILIFVVCGACNLQPDMELNKFFDRNRRDFETLLAAVDADGDAIALTSNTSSSSTVAARHLRKCQPLLEKLGVSCGVGRRADFPSAVFFCVECQGYALARDYKGYAHSLKSLSPTEDSLDSLAPGVHFKPFSQHWYLFRDGG